MIGVGNLMSLHSDYVMRNPDVGYEIRLPKINKQLYIVNILSKMDDLIELNKKKNYTLIELSRSISHEYIVK